jgi:hypothetical protein
MSDKFKKLSHLWEELGERDRFKEYATIHNSDPGFNPQNSNQSCLAPTFKSIANGAAFTFRARQAVAPSPAVQERIMVGVRAHFRMTVYVYC